MAQFRQLSVAAFLVGFLGAPSAIGQTDRPWVDPPANVESPSQAPSDVTDEADPPAVAAPAPPLEGPPAPLPADPVSRPAAGVPPPEPVPPVRSAEPPREASPPGPTPPARSAQPPREIAPPERGQAGAAPERARQLAVDYLDFWSAPNAVTLESTPDFYAPRVEFHGREMSARALFELKRRFVRRWPSRAYAPQLDTMRTVCDTAAEMCTVRTAFTFKAASPERRRRSQGMGRLELEISFAGGQLVIVSETSRVTQRGRGGGDASLEAEAN